MGAIAQASQALSGLQGPSSPGPSPCQLTLESSQRLSSGISLHTFSSSGSSLQSFHPSGQIDLLFLEDLDPTRPTASDADRRLTFTPACIKEEEPNNSSQKITILARNGRVTQLLGLPRLQGPLRAEIVSQRGGFQDDALNSLPGTVCIASGTGLAPFLAIASRGFDTSGAHLLWSVNGGDYSAVEFLVTSGLLLPATWASVSIFVTSGEEAQGTIAGKSEEWWREKFTHLTRSFGPNLKLKCGRMTQHDVRVADLTTGIHQVLFCGNKALEWQVKMWFLNTAKVFTTSIV